MDVKSSFAQDGGRTLCAVGSLPGAAPLRHSTRTRRSAAAASGGSTRPARRKPPAANLHAHEATGVNIHVS